MIFNVLSSIYAAITRKITLFTRFLNLLSPDLYILSPQFIHIFDSEVISYPHSSHLATGVVDIQLTLLSAGDIRFG